MEFLAVTKAPLSVARSAVIAIESRDPYGRWDLDEYPRSPDFEHELHCGAKFWRLPHPSERAATFPLDKTSYDL